MVWENRTSSSSASLNRHLARDAKTTLLLEVWKFLQIALIQCDRPFLADMIHKMMSHSGSFRRYIARYSGFFLSLPPNQGASHTTSWHASALRLDRGPFAVGEVLHEIPLYRHSANGKVWS